MLASQYIYTACGKDRTGAFSVFSKSKDITDAESSEIREMMMYKAPPNLPYEPTELQIEEMFPKKFGYSFLSSGRVCLAQVCYVGRVYSELDGRFGNYIIHAFVFEKANYFAPYSFIEHTLFKRMLTKKEWHDDPIPDELPQIEIPENGGMLSMDEITSFFDDNRKNKLKFLIEAIINSSNENPVCFYDEHKNLKYWFKILGICLPKAMQNAISFCTNFTNSLIQGNASSRIQIRVNQPDSYQFNYAQEAQKGRYTFDFLRNIIPTSINPGKYAKNVMKLFSVGVFEVVKFVDNISKVMSTYKVSINEASNLINMSNTDYSNFENSDEIYSTILNVERVGYEMQTIANDLWLKRTQFNFNVEQKLKIFEFIYNNTSSNTKYEIITEIVDKPEHFGITNEANNFYGELNSKANFIFKNYLDYLNNIGLFDYVSQNKNSFLKLCLVFAFLIRFPDVKKSLQMKNYNTPNETIAVKNIIKSVFNRQSIEDLNLLMDIANQYISNSKVELLSTIVQEEINSGFHITNIQFAFDILQQLYLKKDFAYTYLLNLIKTISNQNEFIKAYIDAQNSDPDFYTKFENENKHESLIIDFFRKKDATYFKSQKLTLKALKEYFYKYYVTGADNGLFIKRLSEYLNTVNPNEKIKESYAILNIITLPINSDKKFIIPVYIVVIESIFSAPYGEIHSYPKKEFFDKITEIYDLTKNNLEPETRELYAVTHCGLFLEAFIENDKKALSFFTDKKVQTFLVKNFEMIKSNKNIDIFIDYYFKQVANILILGTVSDESFDYDEILEKVLEKIIVKGDLENLTDNIILGIKKSKKDATNFILYIFKNRFAASSTTLSKKLGDIAEKYFEKLSSGDRKKLFSELQVLAESKEEAMQFKNYFEEFNKEHKSGLLDFFKKKK
jgi:hypothetical protein